MQAKSKTSSYSVRPYSTSQLKLTRSPSSKELTIFERYIDTEIITNTAGRLADSQVMCMIRSTTASKCSSPVLERSRKTSTRSHVNDAGGYEGCDTHE